MKRLLSLVCVAMLAIAASAQATWNVKGGFGSAVLWGSASEATKSHAVAKLGVGLEYPLSSNVSLMPSLEVAWKGVEVDFKTINTTGTLDIFYVQLPVVAAYRLNLSDAWNMTFKAGPYFAYAFYDHFKLTQNGVSNSGRENVNKFDVGLDAGIDFEYHRFVFGIEAEMGFIDIEKDVSQRNLAFYGTVGWKF